jgi:hypothetical protein
MFKDRLEDPRKMTQQMEVAARAMTIPVLLMRGMRSDVVTPENCRPVPPGSRRRIRPQETTIVYR